MLTKNKIELTSAFHLFHFFDSFKLCIASVFGYSEEVHADNLIDEMSIEWCCTLYTEFPMQV